MGKSKQIFKIIKLKFSTIFDRDQNKIFVIFTIITLLSLITYSSYALFMVKVGNKTATNMKMHSLMYSYSYVTSINNLPITSNSGNLPIVEISANTKLYVDFSVTNLNSIASKYKLYFVANTPTTLPSNFSVKYSSLTDNPVSGQIESDETKVIRLAIDNNSDNIVKINLAAKAGYAYRNINDILLENNENEIIEEYNEMIAEDGDGTVRVFVDGKYYEEFPTDFNTYMFNSSGSYCTSGATVTFNDATSKVNIGGMGDKDLCNISFVTKQDINTSIYVNDIGSNIMPSKTSGLIYNNSKSNCTDGASITFDTNIWKAKITNVTKEHTICTLYFNTSS